VKGVKKNCFVFFFLFYSQGWFWSTVEWNFFFSSFHYKSTLDTWKKAHVHWRFVWVFLSLCLFVLNIQHMNALLNGHFDLRIRKVTTQEKRGNNQLISFNSYLEKKSRNNTKQNPKDFSIVIFYWLRSWR
jgi:hypothetical protein